MNLIILSILIILKSNRISFMMRSWLDEHAFLHFRRRRSPYLRGEWKEVILLTKPHIVHVLSSLSRHKSCPGAYKDIATHHRHNPHY